MEVAELVGGYSSVRVCELTGVTYRQIDYWVRTGLIVPSLYAGRGCGTRRRFSRRDVQVVAILGHAEIMPSVRRMLADALRPMDPLPPWIVLVGDWTVKVCTTRTELEAAILAERSGMIRVVFVESLVNFDA